MLVFPMVSDKRSSVYEYLRLRDLHFAIQLMHLFSMMFDRYDCIESIFKCILLYILYPCSVYADLSLHGSYNYSFFSEKLTSV